MQHSPLIFITQAPLTLTHLSPQQTHKAATTMIIHRAVRVAKMTVIPLHTQPFQQPVHPACD